MASWACIRAMLKQLDEDFKRVGSLQLLSHRGTERCPLNGRI